MKIPEKTKRISIGDGKISFFDSRRKLISSEKLKNLNCCSISSFNNYEEFLHFDAMNCTCDNHMLTLSVIKDDDDECVYMSSWARPKAMPYDWWYRIKTMFQILCGKIPFIDEYLFTREQLLVFRALIDKYIKILEDRRKSKKNKKK